MPTVRQKRVAKIRLENPELEKGELVEAGGYSPAVVKTPAKVLESKGYKEALAEYGLTEELITSALVEDINAKPEKRFNELSLGAEILGMKKRDEKPSGTTIANFTQIIINPPQEKNGPMRADA